MLPAYAQDRSILSCFPQFKDATVFEDSIAQLLRHCGRWPEPKSVLVMDNASFHHSEKIAPIYADAGVKLIYLPPYRLTKPFFLLSSKGLSSITGATTKKILTKGLMPSLNGASRWLVQKKRVLEVLFGTQI